MSEETKNNPVIRISLASAIGDKQQMSFETYVDAASPIEFINAMTDKLFFVANRQASLAEVKGMEKLLEIEVNQLAALMGDLDRENKRQANLVEEAKQTRVAYKLPPKDVQALQNIKVNVHERNRRIEKLKEDINTRKVALGIEVK